jgi:hypothetical protein
VTDDLSCLTRNDIMQALPSPDSVGDPAMLELLRRDVARVHQSVVPAIRDHLQHEQFRADSRAHATGHDVAPRRAGESRLHVVES